MPGTPHTVKPALAALALTGILLTAGGCYGSRSSVPAEPQRTTEAEGRKARLAREAEQAQAAEPAKAEGEAGQPPAPAKAAPAEATAVAQAEAAPAESTPAGAKPAAKTQAETYTAPVLGAETPPPALTLQGQYVQIASFGTEKNAENAVAWLKANGYESSRVVRVEQAGVTLHRVQAGPFQDPAAARKALDALKAQWPQAFIPAD